MHILQLTWHQRFRFIHFFQITKLFLSRLKLALNLIIVLLLILLGVGACSYFFMKKAPSQFYHIGCDRTWYPAQLDGKEQALFAFSEDLLQEIADAEDIQIKLILTGPDHLIVGLDNQEFDGILTSMPPTAATRDRYLFSKPFYAFGLVLIVPSTSTISSFKQMEGKVLGTYTGENFNTSINQYPSLLVRPYTNILKLLDDVENNVIDGAILNALQAYSYISGLHASNLKIVTDPLTNKGLRLVTRLDGKELIDLFNKGLDEMIKKKSFQSLLDKWNIK